jgi:hypothetical protein
MSGEFNLDYKPVGQALMDQCKIGGAAFALKQERSSEDPAPAQEMGAGGLLQSFQQSGLGSDVVFLG